MYGTFRESMKIFDTGPTNHDVTIETPTNHISSRRDGVEGF
jgi:hypothetical protein